jgi:hypothetical protein
MEPYNLYTLYIQQDALISKKNVLTSLKFYKKEHSCASLRDGR